MRWLNKFFRILGKSEDINVYDVNKNVKNLIRSNSTNSESAISYIIPKNANLEFFLQIEGMYNQDIFAHLNLEIFFTQDEENFDYSAFDIAFNDVILATETLNESLIKSFCLTDKIKHWIILSQKLSQDEMKVVCNLVFNKENNHRENKTESESKIQIEALNILKSNFAKSFSGLEGCKDFIKIENFPAQQDILYILFKKISNFVSEKIESCFPEAILNLSTDKKDRQKNLINKIWCKLVFDISYFTIVTCLRKTDDIFHNLYDKSLQEFLSYLCKIKDCYIKKNLLGINDDFVDYFQKLIQDKNNEELPGDLDFIAPAHLKYPNSNSDLLGDESDDNSLNDFNVDDLVPSGYGSNQPSSRNVLYTLDSTEIPKGNIKQILIKNHKEFVKYLNSLDIENNNQNQTSQLKNPNTNLAFAFSGISKFFEHRNQ